MKLNLLIFPLTAIFLLAACSSGLTNQPGSNINAIQTAVAGTQTASARNSMPATEQSQAVSAITQSATGLPQTSPDAVGIFDHRQDSSIFVDTSIVAQQDQGSTSTNQDDQSGGPSFQSSSDPNASKVEVVVTSQTIIYKDVTVREPLNGPPPDFQEIKQVEPGSLDEIGQLCLITVWGSRTGDRVIAHVLMYSFPHMQRQ
jgi:hypothetical protein